MDTENSHSSPVALASVASHLDDLLRTRAVPDYANALNGLQLQNSGFVSRVAAAVDFSNRSIDAAIAAEAGLLIVHHGMFWSGLQPLTGANFVRLRHLLSHDIAVYASHLPLDVHAELGNNVLLAQTLDLEPADSFGRYQGIAVGVQGRARISSSRLVEKARRFARSHGGDVRTSCPAEGRQTKHWGLCTGAGASAETLREALELGMDTLIVGEGQHWTAVDARDNDLLVIYAGHYATETLGVQAVARNLASTFGIPWSFVDAPTGF